MRSKNMMKDVKFSCNFHVFFFNSKIMQTQENEETYNFAQI